MTATAIIWFFGLPFYYHWMHLRSVRKLIEEGPRSTLVGWRELELVRDRLRSRTELADTLMDLRAIIRITGNDHHLFIYISPINAIIIPMDDLWRDEFSDFVKELRAAWDRRDELPSLGAENPPGEERISAR